MRIKFPSIVKLLMALAIVGSLVAIAAAPATAADPLITPTPTSGTVGSAVSIKAENYPAGSVLTAKFDGSAMSTSPATVTVPTPATTVNFTVTIPTATAGTHQIDIYQDGMNPKTFIFTVTPKLTIKAPTLKKGPVGTSVTVEGTGFSGAGVTADVKIGTGSDTLDKILVAGVPVDNTGSFTATGNVPELGSGDKVVWARDGQNNASDKTFPAQTWNTFKVTPTLVITPSQGLAGSKVSISGTGWADGEVKMMFGGVNWLKPDGVTQVKVNAADGKITMDAASTEQVIPTSATAGVKVVEGKDTATAIGTFNFTVIARQLTLTPQEGPKGTQVLITGSNMSPNKKILLNGGLKFDGVAWDTPPTGQTAQDITIDSGGMISPTIRVVKADVTVGAKTIIAQDQDGLQAQGTFTVKKPTITLAQPQGPRGSTVTVSGQGWLAGNTVTITFTKFTSTNPLATVTSTPDANGNFMASLTVPLDADTGANLVRAKDGYYTGYYNNEADPATFTVPTVALSVNPQEGAALDSTTVIGSGFRPYYGVTISIGGYTFMNQPLTDALGNFQTTIQIPGVAPGSQTVTACDGPSTDASRRCASSFFVVKQAAATVQSQVAGISSQLVRIWGFDNATKLWKMYDPTDTAGSDLKSMSSGAGYWIDVNAACNLVYGGNSFALSTGLNLIGWQ